MYRVIRLFGRTNAALWRLAAVSCLSMTSGAAFAAPVDLSFRGSFASDDDVQLFDFTTDGVLPVTLRSYSYAGGVQTDGNVVSSGGFDTILAVFDEFGNFIDQNDDGSGVPSDPNTGAGWDTSLQILLPAGAYIVSVMQYDNFAIGPSLSDGFSQSGNPFFTAALGGCSNGQFCDVSDVSPYNNRTNQWAFDILNVQSASPVPIPPALWLFCSGLLGVLGLRRVL